jgi:hypothetical protein
MRCLVVTRRGLSAAVLALKAAMLPDKRARPETAQGPAQEQVQEVQQVALGAAKRVGPREAA